MNIIQKLTELGQSIWMDNIQRRLLENGETQAMIDRGDIRGMTSNPTIFDKAIEKTHDYDEALIPLAWAGWDAEKIFWELIVEDIRAATDLFLPLYEETNGGDGYVSIEVSPLLANDTDASAAQAQQLWARVGRPNLMVKIPATEAGIPAIQRSTAAGININITLIFSLARYAQVMNAYLSGLEERVAAGQPIDQIHSVASFFVSRVDTNVDQRLPKDSPLRGKIAIANAKLAYELFLQTFSGERWAKLKEKGANIQRPLWASTSTKNPDYPDTLYVDNLIGPNTINTMPPQTLEATRDHAKPEITITRDVDKAHQEMEQLAAAGISIDEVTDELEEEGIKSFSESVASLLKTIDERREKAVSALGPLADAVAKRVSQLEADSVPARFWAHDPTLWTTDPQGQQEVTIRMGWTESPEKAAILVPAHRAFADQIHDEGLSRYLVLGMGGSSLTAEVISSLFGAAASTDDDGSQPARCLAILDSTDPDQVAQAAEDFPPKETLYIVASKSGGTAEVMAAFDYFWKLSKNDGTYFVATTDANTSLEQMARELQFRKIFSSDETVGGRYSALTDFGMVPAALLGIDGDRFIARGAWMARQCGRDVPAARNPGLVLGAVLGEAAQAGRDKLTILADKPVAALAIWIEQIVAESSGKNGKGILPVPLEPLDVPNVYGDDRVFVYLRQTGEMDGGVEALREANYPVLRLPVLDPYDAAAEFFRWEVAVPIACHIIGVNAFDQPDVQESKDRTKAKIAEYRQKGQLNEGQWDVEIAGDGSRGIEHLGEFIHQARAGDYFAINAYLPRSPELVDALQRLRITIREETKCAVAAGFGPRFQHSTGQFHKGGPNTGHFIQIVADPDTDMEIPTEGMTFGTLIRAQALGDYETLRTRGRRVIRVHLGRPSDIEGLIREFNKLKMQT